MRGRTISLLLFAALLVSSVVETPAAAKSRKKTRARGPAAAANFDAKLPVLGTRLAEFPPGSAKALADQACLACHATDLVRQQRLTDKQWAGSVNKMVGWGAEVPEARRAELIAYLVANFGPENTNFQPVVTRPVGR